MFTGIVQARGRVSSVEALGGDVRLGIDAGALPMGGVRVGDSIAVNGACLTAIEVAGSRFAADVSTETLRCTTLGGLAPGAAVNLELSLTPSSALGGHLVTGHVDGVAVVVARGEDARSTHVEIEVPAELARYVAAKGSVCVDGVSLTVNTVEGRRFSVNIIPHTAEVTTLGAAGVGTRVNLEVDLLARYVERLIGGGT